MQVRSGFFGKGDMQKEFEEASFALQPGEISQVVQTASGLHLIERYVHSTHPCQRTLSSRSLALPFHIAGNSQSVRRRYPTDHCCADHALSYRRLE
jgi:hypothetical protein